jgi:hypothetical protein
VRSILLNLKKEKRKRSPDMSKKWMNSTEKQKMIKPPRIRMNSTEIQKMIKTAQNKVLNHLHV